MLISVYILFAIIGFISFFIAVFYNESVANLFVWPVTIIVFGALFFASYNLVDSTTVVTEESTVIINSTNSLSTYTYKPTTTYFSEPAFSWMFLALAMLSSILFVWDIWNKANTGDIPSPVHSTGNNPLLKKNNEGLGE